jgi:hypothetical protein
METKTQPEASARKFETLQDIFKDKKFRKFLKAEMEKYTSARKILPPEGMKYKRNAFDTLNDAKQFTAKYLIEQFPDIVIKKSNLSVSTRQLIENVMNESIRLTYRHYNITL